MAADVITIGIVSMTFFRAAVSIDGVWRAIHALGRHLSVIAFPVLLLMVAQNALLSAYHAG